MTTIVTNGFTICVPAAAGDNFIINGAEIQLPAYAAPPTNWENLYLFYPHATLIASMIALAMIAVVLVLGVRAIAKRRDTVHLSRWSFVIALWIMLIGIASYAINLMNMSGATIMTGLYGGPFDYFACHLAFECRSLLETACAALVGITVAMILRLFRLRGTPQDNAIC